MKFAKRVEQLPPYLFAAISRLIEEKKNIKHFHCPFVKINSNTQLISRVVKRQDNEESYIQTRAVTGKQLEAEKVEYILYRHV